MKKFYLKAFDTADIGVDLWDEVESPKACVQITHGMSEHPDRYDEFATFLNKNGFIVAAEDHRGHRRGAINGENGLVYGDSWGQTLEDINVLCDYLKTTYNLPIILLGHSYGSFLAQRFTELHSDKLTATLLSGTSYMKTGLVRMGSCIAGTQKFLVGGDKPGKLINKLSFGAYNKPFAEQGQEFAWLSRDKEQVEKYETDPDCGYILCIDFYNAFFKGVLKMYGKDLKNVRKGYKIMVSCGSDDPVSQNSKNAVKLYEVYKKAGLDCTLKIYEGARHELLNEINKEEVYTDFLAFLNNSLA